MDTERMLNIPFGNINQYSDELKIKNSESPNTINSDRTSGMLKTIKGIEDYSIDNPVSSPIHSLMAFHDDNNSTLLCGVNNVIYKYENNVFTDIKRNTTQGKFDYVNFDYNSKNIVILADGANETTSYDGTEFKPILNRGIIYKDGTSTVDYIIDKDGKVITEAESLNTRCPKFKFIELHYERLWGAGIEEHPSRVYFSKDFDIHDFTTPVAEGEANKHGGYIDIPTFDGGKIIGLKNIFNDIVVFKTHNIFRIFGTYPGNYEKEQLFSTNGAIADRSIQVMDNVAYFVSKEGIFLYNGHSVELISQRIQKEWDKIDKFFLQEAVGIINKDKYVVSIPKDNIVIEFEPNTGMFNIRTGTKINTFINFNNLLLCGDDSSKIKTYGIGKSNVPMIYETKYFMDAENARKNFMYCYFVGSGDGKAKISLETEKKTKTVEVQLSTERKPYKIKLKNKGRIYKFKIENVNGSNIELSNLALLVDLDTD